MILDWWPGWQRGQVASARAELLGVLRFVRLPVLVALAHRHGLNGFNPHRSLHRLVVPPEPPAPWVRKRPAPAPAVTRAPRKPRRKGRYDLDGRRLKPNEHAGWCSHDTRRGCNCGADEN